MAGSRPVLRRVFQAGMGVVSGALVLGHAAEAHNICLFPPTVRCHLTEEKVITQITPPQMGGTFQ